MTYCKSWLKANNTVNDNLMKDATWRLMFEECFCKQFNNDQSVNPYTGRKINSGLSVHRSLLKQYSKQKINK